MTMYHSKEVENMERPICVRCHRDALEHCYSDAGRREVYISGLCEECFDMITEEEEEEC